MKKNARTIKAHVFEEDLYLSNPIELFNREHKKHLLYIFESIRFKRREQLMFSLGKLKLNTSHCGFVNLYNLLVEMEQVVPTAQWEILESQYSHLCFQVSEVISNIGN